ncbi:MAG: glycosyl hydrolase family 2, partial [Ignavibacteriaceae bacterium]|nr:glycosyl hydrolase family 2 [Ignavibacteriaceae bacterium]
MKFFILFFAMIAAAMPQNKPGAIIMPGIFSDNMVLQQKANVTFWGKASPGELVVVNASWGASAGTKADDKGNWKTKIKTIKAGGPYQVKVKVADSTIV